ncbi:MAG: LPS assembly lipoprotein LptE [Nitrospira sp.]|nr:LPS assembly lipoprotein LptE [Nitrospira sp.]
MHRLVLLVVLMLLVVLPGCGYRFSVEGPGPQIGGEPEPEKSGPPVRLVIRDLLNRTFQSNLEFAYSKYLRQEFAVSSGAQVVAEDAQADYVMTGEIVSVTVPSLTFSAGQTRERRVNVVVRVEVAHRTTGKSLWTETATGTGEFFVNRAPEVEDRQDQIQFNRVLQDRALEQAGQQAVESLAAAFWHARDQGIFSQARAPSFSSSTGKLLPLPHAGEGWGGYRPGTWFTF